jgi:phosphatidylglycerophosphate synthase
MVTDRVATTGLLAILCAFYPEGSLLFLVLLMLDISSHWFQMYSTMLAGSSTHKVCMEEGCCVVGAVAFERQRQRGPTRRLRLSHNTASRGRR